MNYGNNDKIDRWHYFLQKFVDDLYLFRDLYYIHNPEENEKKKLQDLTSEMRKTLNSLDEEQGDKDIKTQTEFHLLRAKSLNVLPEFNSEALEILTKVVKFHPKYIEAWNELGECFWKKGDVKAAKSCFESALRERQNAESLRSLSMVLRQLGDSAEEKMANVHLSVEKAKEAVNLNIQDGKSWYILGNAYLSLFFTTNQNSSMLKQCLSSYSQALVEDAMKSNPDLHYNRAVALKYDENFRLALESFDKCSKYDPSWSEPKEQLEELLKHLGNIQLMTSKKGKLNARRVKELLKSLKVEHLGPYLNTAYTDTKGKQVTLKQKKLSELEAGSNPGNVALGKVVCHVYSSDPVSFTFCMIDGNECCFAVNVYNMVQGKGVIIGDSVAIPEPFVEHFNFSFKDKVFRFSSIRVNSPLLLVVNGRKVGPDALATPRISITYKSD